MKPVFRILAALAVAACTQGPLVEIYPQVVQEDIRANYYPEIVSIFGSGGGLTEVYGAPSDGATPAEVVANLRLPHFVSSRRLTAIDPDYPTSDLRLILVFAPQTTALADQACKGRAEGATAGPQMKVYGVFCRGRRAVSEAIVYAEASPGIGDPAFAAALNRLIGTLMPSVDPNRDNGRRQTILRP